jgi:hypothetical protein
VVRTLRARLVFPPTGVARVLPEVTVRIEDVSLADAAASRVSEALLTGVAIPAEGTVLEVAVPAGDPEPGRRYTVRAHGGQGPDIADGDFLTTRSVPVSLDDEETVDVPLRHLA